MNCETLESLNKRKPRTFSPWKLIKVSPDPILGLAKLFKEDKRKNKIDAGIGVFRGEDNKTFTPKAIQLAYKNLSLGLGDYL